MLVEELEENHQLKMEQPNFKIPIDWSKINIFETEKKKTILDKKSTPDVLWRSILRTQDDKQESEGCSLVEKYSMSTMDGGRRLEEFSKWLGMHSLFSTSTIPASMPPLTNEGLLEIVSLVIHEGSRLRQEIASDLGIHSLVSTSAMTASTSATADVQREVKRWSFLEEISKPFDVSLKARFSELEEDAVFSSSTKKEHGDYTCQNVLSIWPKLRNERKKRRGPRDVGNREMLKGPRDVGEEIKKNLPKSDLIIIEEGTSIHDFGFITFSLSQEWMSKSIHKMIKDGIDTWAPKLPVERVIVDYPSLDEEMLIDLFRRRAIGCTLIRMLGYSKVGATIGPTQDIVATFFHRYSERDEICCWAQAVLNRCFSKKKRQGKVVIKGKVNYILAKRDFDNAYKDLLALWYGRCVHQADWIVYVTPVRQQKYIEMCFSAAELENWTPTVRHEPPRTSNAGYRTCTTELSDDLLDEAKTRSKVVEQGDAARLLGYTAEAVLSSVFTFTYLKNHRLAVWEFNIDEMFHGEGNTFVYLLNTRAQIRRVTNDSRKYIDNLKKAELILEENVKWREGEERILEFHLLNFTQILKESCTFVLPHMLCEYLHDLAKKFNSYFHSVCKAGSVTKTSTRTLLLSEATAVVMEKCFHLLGLTPTSSFFDLSLTKLPLGLLYPPSRSMDINARDPPRNSRFELFSVLPSVITDTVREGKLFGLIAVSDNYGILSDDGGFYLDEPDYAYITLFNREWCNPIEMTDCELVYLGNPSCRHSVPFSSSIDIHMRLFVTATNKKKKDKFFQLCNKVIELDISDFWAEKSDATCGYYAVKGVDGVTDLHYMLLKNAVDTTLEVTFKANTDGPKVNGYIFASYGDDFPYDCDRQSQRYYKALLFQPDPLEPLDNGVRIPLRRSMLSVPLNGQLVITAYLEEVESEMVIIEGSCTFKSQRDDCTIGVIKGPEGTNWLLDVKVNWKYQA